MTITTIKFITDDGSVDIEYKFDDEKKICIIDQDVFEKLAKIIHKATPKRPAYGAWSKYYDRDSG
jgi:hypothetical protein